MKCARKCGRGERRQVVITASGELYGGLSINVNEDSRLLPSNQKQHLEGLTAGTTNNQSSRDLAHSVGGLTKNTEATMIRAVQNHLFLDIVPRCIQLLTLLTSTVRPSPATAQPATLWRALKCCRRSILRPELSWKSGLSSIKAKSFAFSRSWAGNKNAKMPPQVFICSCAYLSGTRSSFN